MNRDESKHRIICTSGAKILQKISEDRVMDTPRLKNEFADALATIFSMIKHPDQNYINTLEIYLMKEPAYYSHVGEELDGNKYMESGIYTEYATSSQKKAIHRLTNNFFLSGESFIRGLQILDFLGA